MKVSVNDLTAHYGVDRRTIQRWLSADPPVPSALEKGARVFDSVLVFRWFTERAARRAINDADRAIPTNLSAIRLRYEEARAKLAEIDLAVREGKVVTLEDHTAAVIEICERLRTVLINIPSNYTADLEHAGVSAADAEQVLLKIADSVTAALRATADEMVADDRNSHASLE